MLVRVLAKTRAVGRLGRRWASALLGLLAFAVAGPAFAQSADEAFDAAVRQALAASGAPGLTVAVASGSRILFARAYGRLRQGEDAPVEPGDPFRLVSISKPMTATLIGVLVDGGVLRWDETPAEVWPEAAAAMNPAMAKITLEQLLRHRAGVAAYTDAVDLDAAPKFSNDATEQRAALALWLLRRRPAYRAGEFHYSNAGYGLAAAMAEKATGESWEALMRERLFRPLGLESCGFGWPDARDRRWPSGHRYDNGRFIRHDPKRDPLGASPLIAPAVDISCDGADLARFGQTWLTGAPGLLKPETFRRMAEGGTGWTVESGTLYHLGGDGTFHGALFVMPRSDLVVAVMVNAGTGRPGSAVLNRTVAAAVRLYGKGPDAKP